MKEAEWIKLLDVAGKKKRAFYSPFGGRSPLGNKVAEAPRSQILNDTYTIKVEAPFGYEAVSGQEVTITGTTEEPQTIEIVVPLAKFTVKVNATDNKGDILSGGRTAIYNAVTDEIVSDAEGNPAEDSITPDTLYVLEYNPDGYYAKQTEALKGYAVDENIYGIRNDLSEQTVTFINNITEDDAPSPAPSKELEAGGSENNNSEKVETGNYADSAVFVGILGAVIASIVCVLYLKKKNQDSDA